MTLGDLEVHMNCVGSGASFLSLEAAAILVAASLYCLIHQVSPVGDALELLLFESWSFKNLVTGASGGGGSCGGSAVISSFIFSETYKLSPPN